MDGVTDVSFLSTGCTAPCSTLTFKTDVVRDYVLYIYVTAVGTTNNVYSSKITVKVVCGPASAS